MAICGVLSAAFVDSARAEELTVGTCVAGSYATVQSAVNAAAAGDTIKVCAGTFNEFVTINKTLTLLGAQAGVDGRNVSRTGSPSTESVMVGNSGTTSFVVTAADVRIDGFTIQDSTNASQSGAAVIFNGAATGTLLANNIIQNSIVGLYLSNNSATKQAVIRNNLFRNNNQPGPASGT